MADEALQIQYTEAIEALRLLYDHQNGCPLPKYESGWTEAMKLAEKVLKNCDNQTTGEVL